MTQLTDIIDIQITRETAAVAQTNFNVPLFLAAHTRFIERARNYSSIEAVADDFDAASNVYIAAQRLFSQQLRPNQIVIGRRQVPGATISVTTVASLVSYTLTISGRAFTYTSIANDTAVKIMTGLKTSYDASPVAGVTMNDNGDGTLALVATADWSLTVSDNLSSSENPSTEAWPDAINAVQNENDTWYALAIESHVEADVLATAQAIEAKKKIFGTSSKEQSVQVVGDSDVFSKLKAANYQRTFGIYSLTADEQYPECAWIGYQLQEQPGSNTWAYKELANVTVSRLSDTVSKNILDKNGNTYETVGGLASTIGGKMFGGEWIDVMVFVDWLEQRMKERLWFRMRNSKKIPFTAAGAAIIEAEVRAQLNDGIRAGGLADSPAPVVNVPDVLSIAPNLRAQRIFEGITFEARLAGAIHFVKIRGTVTV